MFKLDTQALGNCPFICPLSKCGDTHSGLWLNLQLFIPPNDVACLMLSYLFDRAEFIKHGKNGRISVRKGLYAPLFTYIPKAVGKTWDLPIFTTKCLDGSLRHFVHITGVKTNTGESVGPRQLRRRKQILGCVVGSDLLRILIGAS